MFTQPHIRNTETQWDYLFGSPEQTKARGVPVPSTPVASMHVDTSTLT